MRKMGWVGLLMLLGMPVVADDTAPLSDMQTAANLYFSYEPQKALAAYTQLAQQTHQREAFLNAIFIAQEQNERTQATKLAAEALELFPQDNEVVETAAEVYLADGQYKRAEQLLSQLPEEPGRQRQSTHTAFQLFTWVIVRRRKRLCRRRQTFESSRRL